MNHAREEVLKLVRRIGADPDAVVHGNGFDYDAAPLLEALVKRIEALEAAVAKQAADEAEHDVR